MMDFVDEFVDPPVMQQAMEEVMPGVLNDSTAKALGQEGRPGREEFTLRKVVLVVLLIEQKTGFNVVIQ